MKIGGKQLLVKNRRGVSIIRDDGKDHVELTVTVTPLSIGFWQKLRTLGMLNGPTPPEKVLRDEKGQLVKNANTGLAQTVPDFDDQKFQYRREVHFRRLKSLEFVEMLREDESVEWEAVRPETKTRADWEAYADAVWKEIDGAGFTEKEIEGILGVGVKLESTLSTEDAFDRFLPQPAEEPEENEAS